MLGKFSFLFLQTSLYLSCLKTVLRSVLSLFCPAVLLEIFLRLADSRSVPRWPALPMSICCQCLSVILPMKHLALATRQQPEPRWQLNSLIISTQNSDVPHQRCGATLAFCISLSCSAEYNVCHEVIKMSSG